ncbi:MAG TPA: NUDIX domain-containing protein [Candidatus Saccharimonadales bacterium]|nr:NUDIX domain-containing protein [Candidatus Saccharimonadales bacterium]
MVHAAGLLIFRRNNDRVEVLLTHPGGPFWAKKDVWSIPKGEVDEGESLEQALVREFKEETGFDIPPGERIDLGTFAQGTRKTNHIWAVEGDVDVSKFVCESTFTTEWPPKSGQKQAFPENDRAAWFELNVAKQKVFDAQRVFVDRLAAHLGLNLVESPQQQSLL